MYRWQYSRSHCLSRPGKTGASRPHYPHTILIWTMQAVQSQASCARISNLKPFLILGNAAHGNIFADYGTLYAMIMPVPCYVFILVARFKASVVRGKKGIHLFLTQSRVNVFENTMIFTKKIRLFKNTIYKSTILDNPHSSHIGFSNECENEGAALTTR